MRKKRERVLPMPTEEEKARARLKATSADPLVWAMKKVDDKFPDEREKDEETVKVEAEIEGQQVAERATVAKKETPKNTQNEELTANEIVDEQTEILDDEDFDEGFDEEGEDDEILNEDLFDDDAMLDGDMLSESDILGNESMNSTEMIDKISAEKKAKKEKKRELKDEKTINKVDPKIENESRAKIKNEKTEAPLEIKAEDKLTMPMTDGVVTMEVTPMRQDVSNVSPDEIKKKAPEESVSDNLETKPESGLESKTKSKFKIKSKVNAKNGTQNEDGKTQVKIMNLEFRQKKMMIGLAVLVILAVVGVMFGIVATVKQSQAAEDFANQLATANTASEDDSVDSDYINIKDWNIRIKIVDGLTNVSYNSFMNDYAEVQIWGAKRDQSANYIPDFAKQNKNSSPLGTVVRVPRYERAAAGRLIWYDDYYNYYYQGPSGVPNVSEDEMSWWVESYLLIKEMLTNADNYITS